MSAVAAEVRPYFDNPSEARRSRFAAIFAQAKADGYITVHPDIADELMQRWASWCAARHLPIIQVWERPGQAWVSIDLVFRDLPLANAELVHLEAAWRDYEPPAHALHSVDPSFCHFAGMDARQAQSFAREVVQLLVPKRTPQQ